MTAQTVEEPASNLAIQQEPLRIGIGGPVGSGKTALTLALCKRLRDAYNIAVVTNDIYTKEDAQFLTHNEALTPDRIIGVETGGRRFSRSDGYRCEKDAW